MKNFGREGVTLFFTLSGFLVGGLLLRQYAETGTADTRRFIIRRIFKIWPAHYLLILVHALAGHHARDTFLLQNLRHLQSYLGSTIAQTWSLAVEERFYVLLPVALLLCARLRLTPGQLMGLLATACVLVLQARCAAVAGGDIRGAYVYTQYGVDSLLFGVMLAVLYLLKPGFYRKLAARRACLAAAVAGLLVWLLFCQTDIVVEECIGFTIQSIGFVARDSVVYRTIAWIGVYSDGIYLWHTLARTPGALSIPEALAHGLPPMVVWALGLVMQFTIAIAVGYLTTCAIEFHSCGFATRSLRSARPPVLTCLAKARSARKRAVARRGRRSAEPPKRPLRKANRAKLRASHVFTFDNFPDRNVVSEFTFLRMQNGARNTMDSSARRCPALPPRPGDTQ